MKTFRRLAALVVFIAAGVVLAVCVATSTPPAGPSVAGVETLAAPDAASNNVQPEIAQAGPSDGVAEQAPSDAGDAPLTEPSSPSPSDVAPASPGADEAKGLVALAASRPSDTAGPPPVPSGNGPQPAEPYPRYGQPPASTTSEEVMLRLAQMLERQQELSALAAAQAAPAPAASAAEETPVAESIMPAEPPEPAAQAEVARQGDGSFVLTANDEDIRTILAMLGEAGGMNILATKSVQGNVSATLKDVDVESALEAILRSTGYVAKREGQFIYVGTPDEFDTMENSLDTVGTRVYRPNYISATELQTLVTPLLSEGKGVASVSTPAKMGIEADATAAGGNDYAGSDVLLVRDYESVLVQIDRMVAEIDVRPAQVHIEAMILSVLLDDKNELGVNFAWLGKDATLGWGTIGADKQGNLDPLGTITFDGSGLKFGFFDGDVASFIQALETVGDTNVIATPRLMALNKQKAEIHIGEDLGYISTTVSETSSTQSVEFLSTGTILRLRPFVSSDGLIRMEVHPELSTGSVDREGGITLPNKETTQVTSNIMVRDGCTVVIGGLMRDETKTTTSQIPLFGSLPVVGAAFRATSEELTRREIIVLITPRIVYEPDTCREGEKVACEFHRRQAVSKEKQSWYGKRALGRKYFRLAQTAWAEGDRKQALRFAELAVHFNPSSRAAIDLRSDIWLGNPHGDHALGGDRPASASTAAGPSALDGEALPSWLLGELEHAAAPQPPPVHPLDRGRPGTSTELNRPRKLQ